MAKPKAPTIKKRPAPRLDLRTSTCIEQLELLIALAKTGKQRLYIAGVSTGIGGDVTVTVGAHGEPPDLAMAAALHQSLSAAWRIR